MYWIDISVAHIADTIRKHGTDIRGKFIFHRFFFNLSCCALSVYAMQVSRETCSYPSFSENRVPASRAVPCGDSFELGSPVNTVTLSLAISFWMNKSVLVRLAGRTELVCHEFLGFGRSGGLDKAVL